MQTVEGILNEPKTNFVGKDGFYWWIGEVEDIEDPMELGRCKVRVLGYYTNVRGGTTADLPTEALPWATVLQHTCQAGNAGQGESSGQLQPGAIVMGFFMDGEDAQMPIVIGVLRVKKAENPEKHTFVFTGKEIDSPVVNPALRRTSDTNSNENTNVSNTAGTTQVNLPGSNITDPGSGGIGSPNNIGTQISGSSGNTMKGRNPENPIPTANGVGGPWKSVEAKLSYLMEDLVDSSSTLVATEDSGNFIDIVSGKVVTMEKLTRKLKNFMGAIFTQIVSGIRQSTSNLVNELGGFLSGLLGSLFGSVPFAAKNALQKAITSLLSGLCAIDGQIAGFINSPMATIEGLINGMLNGLLSKAEMLLQGVQAIIDSIVCNVENVLADMKKVIGAVKTTTEGISGVKDIISQWEKGDSIFEPGTNLMENGLAGLTGLVALFSNIGSGDECDRKPNGGKAKNGFYPLFGVTSCSDEELENINKIRGKRGACAGESAGTGILDQVFNKADPYLQAITTFTSGGYTQHIGTPGRQAHVVREPSGTVHTSININNNTYAEYMFLKQIKDENPDITQEEIDQKLEAYKKSNRGGSNDDTGNLVADHTTYAGNRTMDVIGDDCGNIDGDYVRNIEGDYRLKVTGDCHIEVGGGFFMDAVGAAKQVDKNGKDDPDKEKVQKHTITFNSDLDMSVAGADFQLQASKILVGSKKYEGIIDDYTLKSDKQDFAATQEIVISADTALTHNTPNMFNNINTPVSDKADKPGITTICYGDIKTDVLPANPHARIPSIVTTNEKGPMIATCGDSGYDMTVLAGKHLITSEGDGGSIQNITKDYSIVVGGRMDTNVTKTYSVKAKTIYLN